MLTEEDQYKKFAGIVEYCPVSGKFTRKDGKEVKPNRKGYICFSKNFIKNTHSQVSGHRLAWYIHYGEVPDTIIDHKNRVRHDNRIDNLRKSCSVTNGRNSSKHTSSTKNRQFTSKYKGVRRINNKNPWQARIRTEVGGLDHSLGCYATEEEAARAYDKAAIKYFGKFACINGV